VRETKAQLVNFTREPPPEPANPNPRLGLRQVYPGHPLYLKLCREQGIEPRMPSASGSSSLGENGAALPSPVERSAAADAVSGAGGGERPKATVAAPATGAVPGAAPVLVNGASGHEPGGDPTPNGAARPNGVNGTVNGAR
jgi:hypothetical protein